MSKKKDNLRAIFYPGELPFESYKIPYIYKEIYFEGVYIDVFNQMKDMTVVDVGANIGIVTDYMRPYAKKIYAVEPLSSHFAALKKNKEYNEWDNVELFNMAIAGKNGEVTMHPLPSNMTSTSYVNDYGAGGEVVKAQDMETFFKENNIEKVDFMKFDVEGAEDDILRSEAFQRVAPKIDRIMVEFHYPTWQLLVQYMQSLGYQARQYDSSAIIVLFFR